MPFDPKNRSHKKQLYKVLRTLSDLDPTTTPEMLFDAGVGRPVARGIDYMSNVRKGDYNSTFAALIHRWLLDNHFPAAHRFAPDIFPETPAMRWRAIFDERAMTGRLRIVPVRNGIGIVQRASALASADTAIKLGQQFCFELASDQSGYGVLLQGLADQWQAIGIGQDGGYVCQIEQGETLMPRLADGRLDPLVENDTAGLHEFVLIVGSTPDIPFTIDHLISWVHAHDCEIHRLRVTIG